MSTGVLEYLRDKKKLNPIKDDDNSTVTDFLTGKPARSDPNSYTISPLDIQAKDGGTMPFKSKAQQKFMYANKPKGVNLQEWSDKTNFKKLPEHAEDGKPFSGIQDALRQEQPPVDADELAKQQADAALVQPHHEIPPEEGEELPETSLENLEAAKQNKIIDRQEHPTKEKMLEFVNSKRAAQGMPLMKVAPNLADEPQSMDSGEEYQKRKMEILKRMAGR